MGRLMISPRTNEHRRAAARAGLHLRHEDVGPFRFVL